jgi:hypothetical protein
VYRAAKWKADLFSLAVPGEKESKEPTCSKTLHSGASQVKKLRKTVRRKLRWVKSI